MRSRSDGILVGVGSVLADDPELDVRLPGMNRHHPTRIVADSRLQTPLTGRLAQTSTDAPTILLTAPNADTARAQAFQALGAQIIEIDPYDTVDHGFASSGLSMAMAMERLAETGIGTLFCEGGGRLAASLVRENVVDEIVWFTAGATMGAGGAPSIADFGLETIAEMPRFAQVAQERVGDDVMSVWRPNAS